jgi:hypothetical protein
MSMRFAEAARLTVVLALFALAFVVLAGAVLADLAAFAGTALAVILLAVFLTLLDFVAGRFVLSCDFVFMNCSFLLSMIRSAVVL